MKRALAVVLIAIVPAGVLLREVGMIWGLGWALVALIIMGVVHAVIREPYWAVYLWAVADAFALCILASATLGEANQIHLDRLALGVGVVLTTGLIVFVVFLASEFIFVYRGGDRWGSFLYLLSSLTGRGGSYRTIKEGEVSELKSMGPLAGQGASELIIIDRDQAVVFECAGHFTRIEGPGIVFTKPFEEAYKTIITRQRFLRGRIEETFTKDGIPITVDFSVLCRIAAEPGATQEYGKPYPFSKEAVFKAAYNSFNWEVATREVAGNLLRDRIACCYLDDLYDPSNPHTFPLRDMTSEIKTQLARIAENWGAEVRGVRVLKVEVPEGVKTQMLERWQSEWGQRVAVAKAEAQAERSRVLELERVRAESTLLRIIAEFFRDAGLVGDAGDIVKLRFAETLDRIIADPSAQQRVADAVRTMRGIEHFTRDVPQEDFFT